MRLSTIAAVALTASGQLATALDAPFHTEDRWIIDNAGNNFTYKGVNWPGHGEVMVPEGLQFQSVANIVGQIKSLGFNSIRLTFATEMVDNIVDGGGDKTIQNAFTNALGSENGTKVYEQVVRNNPQFGATTTRLQAYDAIAAECNARGIYIHLDNHVSKGMWCCSFTDGNSWFGDDHFDVSKWRRGLEYMVKHAASWPNFVSIGLRNELRPDLIPNIFSFYAYTWPVWLEQMLAAAAQIHAANPAPLIFFGGINSDTTLYPIPSGSDLGGGARFLKASLPYADKAVLELHNYDTTTPNCELWKVGMRFNGFSALRPDAVNYMPVLMTEFGFSQTDATYESVYAGCMRDFMTLKAWTGWMAWVLGGRGCRIMRRRGGCWIGSGKG